MVWWAMQLLVDVFSCVSHYWYNKRQGRAPGRRQAEGSLQRKGREERKEE